MPNVSTYSITNDSTSTITNGNVGTSAVTVSASLTVSGGIVSATVSTKDSWTWTQTNTSANSSGTTSSATAAIGDPSFGYGGNISQIAVYWDTIYNSFMFAAVPINQQPFSSGTLYDPDHKLLVGQKVVLTLPGRIFQTYTDRKGVYKFFGLSSVENISDTLTVGTTKKAITIGANPAKIDVTIPRLVPRT